MFFDSNFPHALPLSYLLDVLKVTLMLFAIHAALEAENENNNTQKIEINFEYRIY